MTDVFGSAERSAVMRSVKSGNTGPELAVRRLAHGLGLRFRLHRADLPGRPDLVFPSRRIALFVHGCFWHGHDCARGARVPKSNEGYWRDKVRRNRARDQAVAEALDGMGWIVRTIWECETRDPVSLSHRLRQLIEGVSKT